MMNWWTAAGRILALVAASAAVGWYYGVPLQAAAAVMFCMLCYWLYQLREVQHWVRDPSHPPPDVIGVWGSVLRLIYQHQRQGMEAQEKLQSMVDYLQDSFAAMRDAVVMIDERGNISWANGAAGKLLNLNYPEDAGRAILNLVRQPEFHVYLGAQDYTESLKFFVNGEERRYLRLDVTRFGDGNRLLFFRDITALEQMERIRRDFVGNVSHELRSPLTVITGYLGTLLADVETLPPNYRKPLEQMLQQAGRMESLLEDLLWLSRIEAEEREEKTGSVDIRALVDELHDELRAGFPGREIRVDVDSAGKVRGNYRELYSAVSNLVLNALKYSADDTEVAIRWAEGEDGWCLSVHDQGIGIDTVHIPRLTERFYRVDDSRSSATGGTGLGLAIVKHVAASNKAELRIESELGRGSVFTLLFPRQEHGNPGS